MASQNPIGVPKICQGGELMGSSRTTDHCPYVLEIEGGPVQRQAGMRDTPVPAHQCGLLVSHDEHPETADRHDGGPHGALSMRGGVSQVDRRRATVPRTQYDEGTIICRMGSGATDFGVLRDVLSRSHG